MTRAIMRDSRMFDRNSRPCAGCLRMCVYTSFFERFIIVASRLRLFYRGAACIYIRFIVRDCALHLSRLKGNYVGTRIFFFTKFVVLQRIINIRSAALSFSSVPFQNFNITLYMWLYTF